MSLFQADEMVNNLRTAFKELVDESVWMDKETQVSLAAIRAGAQVAQPQFLVKLPSRSQSPLSYLLLGVTALYWHAAGSKSGAILHHAIV